MDQGLTREGQRGSKGCYGRRRFFAPWFCLPLLLGACQFQRQPPEEITGSDDLNNSAASEVEAMLLASAASWNRGDLDGFLDDYWRSEDLTFSGATGITRGWEGVEARYRESYWAPGTVRDSLRFENIEVVPLGEEHALALGQYVLFRPEEGGTVTSSGYFSLVLQKVGIDWKILHDHTSATPEGGGPS
jgi:ketosteroid isomerase-like protein